MELNRMERDSDFEPSSSVLDALSKLGMDNKVSAGTIATHLLRSHSEYANGAAKSLKLKKSPTLKKSREWLQDVEKLFDADRLTSISESAREAPVLHGRLFIIGLCLLEQELRRELEKANVFPLLIKELSEPLVEILSAEGQYLFEGARNKGSEVDLIDTVPTWPDDPIIESTQDFLGRSAFARFLAERIASIPRTSEAYSIHICGPWGSGKSTLLNFLKSELEQRKGPPENPSEKWIVVEFNAWLHQHIQPPWWSLMDRVYQVTKRRLTWHSRLNEFLWRLNSGRIHYFVIAAVLIWAGAFAVPYLFPAQTWPNLEAVGKGAEGITKVIALVATIWGGMIAFRRSLLFSSSQAAQTYTELTHDPTGVIKRRFKGLMKELQPTRVAIFVDDLDRCQSRYVVDLLEGVQTLFRGAPVVFVVSADRHWLNACYAEIYKELNHQIHEPGKPLGALFLEKAFRFSTPLPGIPDKLKERYWDHLLNPEIDEEVPGMSAARRRANSILKEAGNEVGIRNELAKNKGGSFEEQRALREEAAVKLASPKIIGRIEHTLRPYAKLLEPNPRAMKLLVNNYSANRALSILSEVEIELHQLALWTILCARWPQLADFLAEKPEMRNEIADLNADAFPPELRSLVTEPEVVRVINGDSELSPLTTATLHLSARMRT